MKARLPQKVDDVNKLTSGFAKLVRYVLMVEDTDDGKEAFNSQALLSKAVVLRTKSSGEFYRTFNKFQLSPEIAQAFYTKGSYPVSLGRSHNYDVCFDAAKSFTGWCGIEENNKDKVTWLAKRYNTLITCMPVLSSGLLATVLGSYSTKQKVTISTMRRVLFGYICTDKDMINRLRDAALDAVMYLHGSKSLDVISSDAKTLLTMSNFFKSKNVVELLASIVESLVSSYVFASDSCTALADKYKRFTEDANYAQWYSDLCSQVFEIYYDVMIFLAWVKDDFLDTILYRAQYLALYLSECDTDNILSNPLQKVWLNRLARCGEKAPRGCFEYYNYPAKTEGDGSSLGCFTKKEWVIPYLNFQATDTPSVPFINDIVNKFAPTILMRRAVSLTHLRDYNLLHSDTEYALSVQTSELQQSKAAIETFRTDTEDKITNIKKKCNDKLEKLREELKAEQEKNKALEAKLKAYPEDIDTLMQRLASHRAEIESFKSSMLRMQNRNKALEARLETTDMELKALYRDKGKMENRLLEVETDLKFYKALATQPANVKMQDNVAEGRVDRIKAKLSEADLEILATKKFCIYIPPFDTIIKGVSEIMPKTAIRVLDVDKAPPTNPPLDADLHIFCSAISSHSAYDRWKTDLRSIDNSLKYLCSSKSLEGIVKRTLECYHAAYPESETPETIQN